MTEVDTIAWREADRWFRKSREAAERCLPQLLALSGPELAVELERHAELQPGVTQLLLELAAGAVEIDPDRARELTAAIVHAAPPLSALPPLVADHLRGQAWTVHADALRAAGRYDEARDAVATARRFYGEPAGNPWYVATVEVVAARILYDEGERAEALRRIRAAANVILTCGGVDRYVTARMIEAWMQWDGGDRSAAAEVWRAAADEACRRGDAVVLALLESRIGMFLLQHGHAADAVAYFEDARFAFAAAGRTRETLRARWGLAAAPAAAGSVGEAISDFLDVQARMLERGDAVEAAIASAAILELLLLAGREREALPLAACVAERFRHAGLTLNALHAWVFVGRRARGGRLTAADVAAVRVWFERLPLRPTARFVAPERRA